jgi:predicted amino acid dehydrogenase
MFNDFFTLFFNLNFKKRKIDFAFIIHPRYTADIYRKYPILKILPDALVESLLLIFFPTYGGGIYNVEDVDGNKLKGALIICPLTSKQMLSKREFAKKKVAKAVKLAEKYGARVVGLGALNSSVTNGGEDIVSQFPNITLTSGNSLTTFITGDDVIRLVKSNNLAGTIAIIGATGSIGAGVSEMIARNLQNPIICVGKTPHKVEELVCNLSKMTGIKSTHITGSVSTDVYKEAEIIVVSTSAHNAVLHNYLLGQNLKAIYDVTQPKNTPEDVQNRDDILFIDGGLIKLPEEVKITLDIGLPKGIAYSCLSETIILCAEKMVAKKSGSKLSQEFMAEIGAKAAKRNFASHLIYHSHGNTKLSI